jgi:V-type H+-transporting ATPase subunit a
MGFFAIYCGLIYNDFAGFSMNIFNSCYDTTPIPPPGGATRLSITPRPDCVYYFGVDPAWGVSTNSLTFVNSLKMKISVIIAIVHMTLGICCKAANSIYFRKKLDFIFEFVPQFIFFVLLFGYMDFLIVFKWVKSWTGNTAWAPSIITTMMNVGLKLGKTVIYI